MSHCILNDYVLLSSGLDYSREEVSRWRGDGGPGRVARAEAEDLLSGEQLGPAHKGIIYIKKYLLTPKGVHAVSEKYINRISRVPNYLRQ